MSGSNKPDVQRTKPDEMRALQSIVRTLDSLDSDVQRRVLVYIQDRYLNPIIANEDDDLGQRTTES